MEDDVLMRRQRGSKVGCKCPSKLVRLLKSVISIPPVRQMRTALIDRGCEVLHRPEAEGPMLTSLTLLLMPSTAPFGDAQSGPSQNAIMSALTGHCAERRSGVC